ncbi:MAG: glycosyltransferase family 2 protein [Bacilli bacterium]|nr:glycosyltransferase family 2 protein [Bacilli bacterium]
MKISIVTATYNRANLLPILYESINKNYKFHKNIEWIIVDDGSKDETKKIVDEWVEQSKYKIKYFYQENSGKMMAINNGMAYVTGDVVIEIDSDDYLVDDACKIISEDYKNIKDENVYGIIYKKKIVNHNTFVDEKLNGKTIKLFDMHYKYGYDFDMILTFKSDIRKKYNYLLENGEKFITEARLYYKMDQDYDGLIFKNKELIVCEYMQDGYTNNIKKLFKKYPYGYYAFFKECLNYKNNGMLLKKRFYLIKHYILFSYLTHKTIYECIKEINGINKLFVILFVIPGYIKSKKFV